MDLTPPGSPGGVFLSAADPAWLRGPGGRCYTGAEARHRPVTPPEGARMDIVSSFIPRDRRAALARAAGRTPAAAGAAAEPADPGHGPDGAQRVRRRRPTLRPDRLACGTRHRLGTASGSGAHSQYLHGQPSRCRAHYPPQRLARDRRHGLLDLRLGWRVWQSALLASSPTRGPHRL